MERYIRLFEAEDAYIFQVVFKNGKSKFYKVEKDTFELNHLFFNWVEIQSEFIKNATTILSSSYDVNEYKSVVSEPEWESELYKQKIYTEKDFYNSLMYKDIYEELRTSDDGDLSELATLVSKKFKQHKIKVK